MAGKAIVRPSVWIIAVLLALAALIVLERVHTFAEPIERDIAGYAVIGHEMLGGRRLYSDLWERKPPLLYATFAAAERVVGYGPREVFLVNVAAALATLGGCYAAGRVGGPSGGLVAAGLWALLGGDLWSEANQPNAEVFVNAALTAAVAVLVRPGRAGWRTGVVVGALFAAASLYEHHVVIVAATLAAGYVWAGDRQVAKSRAGLMGIAAGVGAAAWGGLAGYFAIVGRLGAAIRVLFSENVAYGGSFGANLASAFRPEHLYPECMTWIGLPALLVLLALVGGRRSTPVPPWRIWVGWAIGTWVTVALPGRFFPHYYQCWIPPMCVAAGWAAGRLLGGPWGIIRVTRSLAVAVVVVILAGRELLPYAWSADEWASHKYTGDNFVEQAYLARRLDGLLRKDERFWVLGQDNTLYFLTRRSPVSGLLYLEQVDDPRTRSYWSRLIGDLDAGRPALVVVRLEWVGKISADAPLLPWIRANYDPLATDLTCPSYGLWVRRDDDDLRQRLLHPPPAAPFRREDSNFRP